MLEMKNEEIRVNQRLIRMIWNKKRDECIVLERKDRKRMITEENEMGMNMMILMIILTTSMTL